MVLAATLSAVDVVLALRELAANAVRYGGGSGRMQMRVTGAELVCQVSDFGSPGLNGIPGCPASRGQPWPYQRGHGLWLVRQVADDMSVISGRGGSRVTVVFALVPGQERAQGGGAAT